MKNYTLYLVVIITLFNGYYSCSLIPFDLINISFVLGQYSILHVLSVCINVSIDYH